MDMQEILRNVITSTNEIFRAEAGSVALLEADGREIVIRAAVGAGAEAVRGLRLPASVGVIGWVATQEEPALIPDVTADDRFFADIDKDSGFNTKSIMCVPMRANGHVIGVIELMNMNAHYLSDDGLKILGVIADHAALAIENARLLTRTRQQAEEQAMVFGAMAILTSDLGLDTVLDAVSRQMVEALNADVCIIYRWIPHQNQLQAIQYYNKSGLQRPARLNLALTADTPTAMALARRKPVIIHAQDKDLAPQQKQRMTLLKIESSLVIPLIYRRLPIGLVEIGHHNPQTRFALEKLILGETMAAQAAVAIEHARLFHEATRRLNEARLLQEVMVAAASTLNFDQVLNRTIDALHRTLGIERLGFFLPNQTQSYPVQTRPVALSDNLQNIPIADNAVHWVCTHGQPLVVTEAQGLPPGLDMLPDTQSEICVPVMLDEQVVAVLNAQSPRPNAFDQEDLNLFITVAAELAVALKNATLFEKEHRLVNQQQALLDIFAVLSAELEPEKLFQRMIERAVEVIPNAEAGSLIVPREEGGFCYVAAVGFNLKQLQPITFSTADFARLNNMASNPGAPQLRVRRFSQPELMEFHQHHDTEIPPQLMNFGRLHDIKSTLRATLVAGNNFLGALNVDSFTKIDAFNAEDEKILLLFANQAAIAIQNARLFEKVKATEAKYRDLFDNANDLIFTLDSNFKVSSANKVTLKLTGYSLPEIIGLPAISLISSTQNISLFATLKQHLRHENAFSSFELSLMNKAGQEKLIEATMRIKRSGRRATELHFIARDITLRRELERQLQQTEKLSSIGKLVAGVAHELNNPLTSIIGYTNLLEESNLLPQQKRDLQIISRQAERARVIVRDLLTFARNIHLEREFVDINEIINGSIMLLKPQLKQHNIHVINSLNFGLPRIMADPHRLEQVIVNLLINSIQALSGQARKKVIVLKSSLKASAILISLADNGPGIREEIINQVFDPFFSTKQVGEGTGLGLSICFGIISAHGGKIWAENIAEGGTEFFVTLPVSNPRADSISQKALSADAPAQATNRKNIRVLVVDDETYLLELMNRVLGGMYKSIHTVDNGRKALTMLLTENFDIIICDILMPDLSGIELFNQVIAAQPQLAERFIFITGNVIDSTTRSFLVNNHLKWLAKPFLPADIISAINETLDHNRIKEL